MLELHSHTTFSDGTLTPTHLVEAALAAGVKALAITDHDTLAGWDEARRAAGTDLEIVPGVELSTSSRGKSVHILGFYPDPDRLAPVLEERVAGRRRRAQAMVEKLRSLGYPIELNWQTTMTPGRPHLAAALVTAGHADSIATAFDRWLAEGKPAFVPYEPLDTIAGIRLLRKAGAVTVWAHPYLWKGGSVEQVLPDWIQAGLMGLEVIHPSHMPHQRDRLLALTYQYGLLKTGGSDYHGPSPDPKGQHASQLNRQNVPLEWLTPLQQAAQFHPSSQATT